MNARAANLRPGKAKAATLPRETWTVEHDAALIASKGKHGALAKLSDRWWIAESVLRARWLWIRGHK